MSIITHTDRAARLHIVFDDERTAPPAHYTIWIEGRDRVIVAQPFESPAVVWQRVLGQLADMRDVIRRGAWEGRDGIFATIYAGIRPTEQQKQAHIRDWIVFCLTRLASPSFNKDGDSRVQALVALSELHGITAPRVVNVTLLADLHEQVKAEIARREVQQ
ncbi:MAG: hypothetical protein C3F19_12230 [Rhodocyclales bacterium]|nr:MAG: hypothetical protein C3F19_12230 [Rhodocyclales bacterium]